MVNDKNHNIMIKRFSKKRQKIWEIHFRARPTVSSCHTKRNYLIKKSSNLFLHIESVVFIRNHQFKLFLKDCLIEGMMSLYSNVKRLVLHSTVVISTLKQKVVHISSSYRIYLNLYIASEAIEGDLDKLIAQENHAFIVSIWE